MASSGFLVPSWYHGAAPSESDMNIASLMWGFSLACACFTFVKGIRQTANSWSRTKTVNIYIFMIWAEWIVCVIISVISWLFLKGIVPISFWFLFFLLVLWVIQIQCTMQIIINRIALLMVNPAQVRTLKLSVLALITLINISVFCIWIPAQLQISQTYININIVWDRMEKAIIAVVDVGLNFYFIHLVRARLIANGLTKYTRLFHFNLVMIAISLSLDVILIGVMSLPSSVVYIQFHPLVYLVKLHIEMNIADLIACVVRESNPHSTGSGPSYGNGQSSRQQGSTKMTTLVGTRNHGTRLKDDKNDEALVPLPEQDGRGSHTGPGIRMTVETQVMHSPRPFKEDDDLSESSSTREIYNHFAVV